MLGKTTGKKIIWAVDPFTGDSAVLKSAAWSIRALVQDTTVPVHPVYVVPEAVLSSPNFPKTDFLRNLQKEGQEAIEEILTRIKINGIQPLSILSRSSGSVRDEARDLIAFAHETEAELIVTSSQGHKGIKRWLLGSFAETLSLYSDVPLLIVHPNWKRTPSFKTILFPTDFSAESLEAYERVLEFAAEHKSRIVLFYKLGSMGYPVFDLAFTTYAYYEKAIREERLLNEKRAAKLVRQAKERGVRVNVIFDRSKIYSVSDSILSRSKKLSCMIAMVSHSGPVATVVMGSTTRQVVRYSEQPVWVIHPKAKAAAQGAKVEPLVRVTQEDIETDLFQHGEGQSA